MSNLKMKGDATIKQIRIAHNKNNHTIVVNSQWFKDTGKAEFLKLLQNLFEEKEEILGLVVPAVSYIKIRKK